MAQSERSSYLFVPDRARTRLEIFPALKGELSDPELPRAKPHLLTDRRVRSLPRSPASGLASQRSSPRRITDDRIETRGLGIEDGRERANSIKRIDTFAFVFMKKGHP